MFMSNVRDNSAPKIILDACWGARDRSPFLAKPVFAMRNTYITSNIGLLKWFRNMNKNIQI